MTGDRPVVLAVSNSEQHRETLSILLDSDFEVTAVSDMETELPLVVAPGAVVLSPTSWSERVPVSARSVFPRAGIVLLDPPAAVTQALPDSLVATWSDPGSVRAAVARATGEVRGESSGAWEEVSRDLIRILEADIRRPLHLAKVLAEMVRAVALPSSSHIATRLLAQQLSAVSSRMGWADGLVSGLPGEPTTVDLGEVLRSVLGDRTVRFLCRGLVPSWTAAEPFRVCMSPASGHLAAGCLADHLLTLRPGEIRLIEAPGELVCRHPDLGPESRSFPLVVFQRLLERGGLGIAIEAGRLRIRAPESK